MDLLFLNWRAGVTQECKCTQTREWQLPASDGDDTA